MATLRQLKTFVATAEYRNMSEAARHLYISQPTVSQIISDLEKEYNTVLFERQGRELMITPAGMLLLESAKQIISIYESLEQNMNSVNSSRPLKIGATVTIGTNIMGKIAENLAKIYPDIDAQVTVHNTNHIEQMLIHNELDIALVEGIITNPDIISKPALLDTLCIICGKDHPFAQKESVSVEDLRGQNFILREKGSGTRGIFEQLMQVHHIPFKVKWESTSTPAIVDAVSRNLGLGFVSERCAAARISEGGLYRCPVREINLKRFFYLCHNRCHPITTQMQDFINYISSLPSDFQ